MCVSIGARRDHLVTHVVWTAPRIWNDAEATSPNDILRSVGGVVPTSNIHPLHRELKRGTLGGILRQARVGAAEFNAALG